MQRLTSMKTCSIMSSEDIRSFKICVIGDRGVGKRSFVNRYCHGIFTNNMSRYNKFFDWQLQLNRDFETKMVCIDNIPTKFEVWNHIPDGRFQDRYPSLKFFHNANVILLFYDLINYASFTNAENQ